MPRRASTTPTDRELDILNVLWRRKTASLSEIRSELSEKQNVAASTVATMLKVMTTKGLVSRTEDREWKAEISPSEAGSGLISKLVDRVFDGSVHRLVAQVIDSHALREDEIEELRELLAEHRGQKRKRKGTDGNQP